jgi:lipopolysaccharide/colanic/teichoic acid biosynthesis glycosyltransferase
VIAEAEVLAERVARQASLPRAVKRGFDIACGAVGLALTAPLLATLAALIRLDSRGPAFYRGPRMGRGQRSFVMIKLRTMDGSGRVTRVGRWLRPTGLDELPQLWHVLTGRMSVVGPRPEVLDRVAGYQARMPLYAARHLMRPGITGWAQVNGLRGEASPIDRRLEHDLYYVGSWSLGLDARILWRTPAAIWRDLRRR